MHIEHLFKGTYEQMFKIFGLRVRCCYCHSGADNNGAPTVAGGRRRGPKGLFVEFDSWLSDDSTAFHGFLEFGVGEEGLRLLY